MRATPSFLRPWNKWLSGGSDEAELHEVLTRDGLRLSLRHIPGDGPAVMLLHGLGANSRFLHFPGRSLAKWLAEAGYDVWVPELRGHGTSERDGFAWGLDEYLDHDLPALIGEILRLSGRGQLDWVGHSMGGILLYCYGILHPEAPVASGLTMGAALDYRIGGNIYAGMVPFKPLISLAPAVPVGTLFHLAAPLMGRAGTAALTAGNVWAGNIEPEVNRRLHAVAFNTVPTSLLLSLATTFEPRGMRLRDGSVHFVEEAGRFRMPVRLLAGSRDQQAAVEAVCHTAGLLRSESELRVFGRAQGEREEYGHCDLVLGRNAPQEVWPDIRAWLDKQPRG